MNKVDTLMAYSERVARRDEKRAKLLRFLREYLWSSADVLQEVFAFQSSQVTYKTLRQFEGEGIIRRYQMKAGSFVVSLWGITAHGQALAFDPAREEVCTRYFEPAKCAVATLRHSLDVQRLSVRAEAVGWSNIRNGERLHEVPKGHIRPDFVGIDTQGNIVSVEVERTIKTTKRYQVILAAYLQAIRRNKYQAVVWVAPSDEVAHRLRKIILGIKTVTVANQRVPIDPVRHHERLHFTSFEAFPSRTHPNLPKLAKSHEENAIPYKPTKGWNSPSSKNKE
jgi:hypothetical protein